MNTSVVRMSFHQVSWLRHVGVMALAVTLPAFGQSREEGSTPLQAAIRTRKADTATLSIPVTAPVVRQVPGINSSQFDYAPFITPDGRTLYFVSNRSGGLGMHDFWYATKANDESTVFSAPQNLGLHINTEWSEGAGVVSADGRTFYFTACGRPDAVGDCDIYMARREGDSWTGIQNLGAVNSIYWESQPAISADGNTLYFVSSRPSSTGGADIYISTRDNDGLWREPRNLGAPINTPSPENGPLPFRDGRLLFFSSIGLGGEGGYDLFYTIRLEDDTWTEPRNLGAPINTPGDEQFITIPDRFDVMYFASTRTEPANAGRLDLYQADMPPRTVMLLITGSVIDTSIDRGAEENLYYSDVANAAGLDTTRTSVPSGGYGILLRTEANAEIRVDVGEEISETFRVPDTSGFLEMRRDYRVGEDKPGSVERGGERTGMRQLAVYPNPASNSVTIDCSSRERKEGSRDLIVTNALGNRVLQTTCTGDRCRLDVRGWPSGVYIAQIAGEPAVARFVVQGNR